MKFFKKYKNNPFLYLIEWKKGNVIFYTLSKSFLDKEKWKIFTFIRLEIEFSDIMKRDGFSIKFGLLGFNIIINFYDQTDWIK